ncbi:NAD(P)/FAD-dependent oxidoreductase [Virgibacillus oceani]
MKVIIIGSGIAGTSAAYHLVKNNIEVVMVDNHHEGNATAAGAGIVCPWMSKTNNQNWYQMVRRGAKYYPELIAQLKEDGETNTGYKKVGALAVSLYPEEMDRLMLNLENKYEDAPEMGMFERMSGREAKELFPPLNEEFEAVYVSGGARVDGRLLRDALKRAAEKNGAEMMYGEAELISDEGNVKGVRVNGGNDIYADSVIATGGAWAPELLKPLGLQLKVMPQRGQIVHLKLPETDTSDWPLLVPQKGHYMLAFDDSRVVAGATREKGSGFDHRVTAGGMAEVMAETLTVAPGLDNGTVEEIRVGFRPMGPDMAPLLGYVQPFNNLILANGLGASGLTMGPYVGSLAASLAVNKEVDIDLSLYDPMRAISKLA